MKDFIIHFLWGIHESTFGVKTLSQTCELAKLHMFILYLFTVIVIYFTLEKINSLVLATFSESSSTRTYYSEDYTAL